jgi:hypothetical protein
MTHIIVQTANDLVNAKPSLESLLITFKDKNIDLDTRWEAYTILVKGNVLTAKESYGDGFIDTLDVGRELTAYDDFYIERHETVKFLDMYERFGEWEAGAYGNKVPPTPESVIAWKEKVLASGYASFRYDW